jgi:hypothetical protein
MLMQMQMQAATRLQMQMKYGYYMLFGQRRHAGVLVLLSLDAASSLMQKQPHASGEWRLTWSG